MEHSDRLPVRQNIWFLLFWPLFLLRYLLVENRNPAVFYHPVSCAADDRIPFLEIFLVPYILWYFCIVGVHMWLYWHNDPAFGMYSRYLMVTMTISTTVFLLYPTCQELRPVTFPRDNLLTDAVRLLYSMDTNTNVCPSEHVIGSVGFFLAIWYAQGDGRRYKLLACIAAVLTGCATVFLKQHSLVDVLAAIPVCIIGWLVAFRMGFLEKPEEVRRIPGEGPIKGTFF